MLLPSLPSLASYRKGIGGVAVAQTGPPVSVVAPFVSGNAYTGQTLSCNGGAWSGAPPIVLTYQWKNAGVNLSGETASTYVLLVTDEGDAITCAVIATNGSGNASATSNTVTPTAAPQVPANSVAPAVSGNAFTGQTLSCSTGTWSQSPTEYAYQWKRAGSNIATGSTYVVVLADVGQSVKCTVTAVNAVGAGTPTDSNAVTPVGIPVNSVAPAVTGTAAVGDTLSCSTGTWSGSPSFTYQWKRDGSSIGGATSSTYLLDALDEATNIKCTVGASNLAGSGTSTDSNTVGPIAEANPELFPGWTTGRVFQWSVDPTDFTVTNYDTITDGGQPALRHHTGGEFSEASVLTNATDIAAARVEFRYRAQPASGLDIQNIALKSQIRYQDANNYWQLTRARGAGASWMSPVEKVAGSDVNHAALAGDSAMDNTNTTTYQTFRMDVFRDVLRAKEWFVGDSEPAWKDTFRFRPSFGFGGSVVTDADNTPETGQAGLRAMYGGIVQDVIVTELVPVSTTNLIVNPTFDPELLDSSGNPFFWGVNDTWTSETTGITQLITTTRMDGASGPVLRVARSATGVSAEGPMWQQSFYINPTITNPYYTRARATPSIGSSFPASINLSIKTKGTNLANTNVGTKLTARWVNYYFDDTGDLNMDDGPGGTGTNYHFAPGPNNGLGTWDWTQITYTLPLYGTGTVLLRFDIGLHDQEATGELLFYDVKFEPVT